MGMGSPRTRNTKSILLNYVVRGQRTLDDRSNQMRLKQGSNDWDRFWSQILDIDDNVYLCKSRCVTFLAFEAIQIIPKILKHRNTFSVLLIA